MAVSIEAKIENGFVEFFGTIPLSGIAVAYDGVPFSPTGEPYVKLTVQNNTPINSFIGSASAIQRGIFLALVRWPVGQGVVKAKELAGKIRDAFAADDAGADRRIINHDGIQIRIGIEEPPGVRGAETGEVYVDVPVIVPWHVFP